MPVSRHTTPAPLERKFLFAQQSKLLALPLKQLTVLFASRFFADVPIRAFGFWQRTPLLVETGRSIVTPSLHWSLFYKYLPPAATAVEAHHFSSSPLLPLVQLVGQP
jgi:hypothetical protein